ncbi:MAG: helix-hairpin-helix domain-containing protein [Pseudomonadota bacterium]|nr:helix-hairpin-helix domain-containing protein [Pseudomonadota bacterium]
MVAFLRKLFGRDRQVHSAAPLAVETRRHDMPMVPPGNEDIITGWRFCATMQMRTPLAILRQHNRLVPASPDGPPQLTTEMWQGIWLPDLGSEWNFLDEGASMASEIGPVPSDGGDYLPFLIAVRTISEGSGTIAEMDAALRALTKERGPRGTPNSKFYSGRALVDRVLPRTIHLLPVPAPVRENLLAAGYKTLAKVQAATDDTLLAIKGLGPKGLANIREFLTTATDLHAERHLAQDLAANAENV